MIKPLDIIITSLCVYRKYNRSAAINLSHFNILERVIFKHNSSGYLDLNLIRGCGGTKQCLRNRTCYNMKDFNEMRQRSYS